LNEIVPSFQKRNLEACECEDLHVKQGSFSMKDLRLKDLGLKFMNFHDQFQNPKFFHKCDKKLLKGYFISKLLLIPDLAPERKDLRAQCHQYLSRNAQHLQNAVIYIFQRMWYQL